MNRQSGDRLVVVAAAAVVHPLAVCRLRSAISANDVAEKLCLKELNTLALGEMKKGNE